MARLPGDTAPLLARLWRDWLSPHRRTLAVVLGLIAVVGASTGLYPALIKAAFDAFERKDAAAIAYGPVVVILGTSLRGFKATVATFCIGPSQPDNRVLIVIAKLRTVRVAPDGGVVGLLKSAKGGREVLTGRLRGGRFTGEISVSLSTCNGTRKFTAVRGG